MKSWEPLLGEISEEEVTKTSTGDRNEESVFDWKHAFSVRLEWKLGRRRSATRAWWGTNSTRVRANFLFFFSPSRVIALSIGRRRGDDELNGATQEASSEVASRRDGQATRGGM